eukprot:jgi/Mesen1/519/ME000104S10609
MLARVLKSVARNQAVQQQAPQITSEISGARVLGLLRTRCLRDFTSGSDGSPGAAGPTETTSASDSPAEPALSDASPHIEAVTSSMAADADLMSNSSQPSDNLGAKTPNTRLNHATQQGAGAPWSSNTPDGSGAVIGRLSNVPRYALASEVVSFFDGCNLRPEDVSTVVDEKVRIRHWRLRFHSRSDFDEAVQIAILKKRLGTRVLRLDEIVMLNCPDELKSDAIEHFFEGYSLAPHAIHHVRILHDRVKTPQHIRLRGEWRPFTSYYERRALVKFTTPLEALRAMRERAHCILDDRPVEIKLLQ